MSIHYIVNLKNGDHIEIEEEQYRKLSTVLLNNKFDIPPFIKINADLVRVDCISSVRKLTW